VACAANVTGQGVTRVRPVDWLCLPRYRRRRCNAIAAAVPPATAPTPACRRDADFARLRAVRRRAGPPVQLPRGLRAGSGLGAVAGGTAAAIALHRRRR